MIADSDLLELAGDLVCVATVEGHFCGLGKGWYDTLGYTDEELMSRPYAEFVHPDDRAATAVRTASLETPGAAITSFENRYRHRDGSYRWFLWVAKTGSNGLVHAVARDVTDQRRKERALRIAETRFTDAFDHAPVGLAWLSSGGEFLRVNESLCRMLGLSEAQLLNSTHQSITHPDDRERIAELRRRMSAGEVDAAQAERTYMRADGSEVFTVTSTTAIREGDAINHFVVSVVDITARKQAEQELQRLSTQYDAIVRSAGDGIYALDLEGRFTLFNPAASATTGWEAAEVLGRKAHELLCPAALNGLPYEEIDCPVCGHVENPEREHGGSALFRRSDGGAVPVDFTSTPMRVDGVVAGAVVTFRDITERERAAAELKRYADNLAMLATRDPLTRLATARDFHAALARASGVAARTKSSVALVLCRIGAGDTAGSRTAAVGDDAELEVARALHSVCSERCSAYQVDRQKFALVAEGASRADATALVGRLENAVGGFEPAFGIATLPDDAVTADQLFELAEQRVRRTDDHAGPATGWTEDRTATEGGVAAVRVSERRPVEQALRAARTQLGMELAHLSAFEDGRQVFRAVQGGSSFGLEEGDSVDLESTYCQRVVDGRLPNLVRDARAHPETKDLPATGDPGIGAYVGVPVVLSDGRIYGTLCCLDHAARPALDDRDLAFMHVIAAMIATHIEHLETEVHRRSLADASAKMAEGLASTRALLAALETRDNYTGSHSEAVVGVAREVALALGLAPREVEEVEQAALLHDIGKVGVPDVVLQKPGPLDELEWKVMREHPAIGARLIASVPNLEHLAPTIRAEHERWDGGGYPDGLAGEDIPLASRIGFACDAFHAMTSDRPYRGALSTDDAVRELEANAGSQFDPRVIAALTRIVRESA